MRLTLLKLFYYVILRKCNFLTSILLVIFLLVYNINFGQEGSSPGTFIETDSAKAYYAFSKFVENIEVENYDSALIYAEDAFVRANDLEDSLLIVKSGYALGFIYRNIGLFRDAQDYLITARDYALEHPNDEEYSRRLKYIYNLLGVSYYYDGIFEQALKAHIESISLRRKEIEATNDFEEANLSAAYTNIGLVYYKLGDLQKAIDYQHKAILDSRRRNSNELATNFTNLGLIYSQMMSYDDLYPEQPKMVYSDSSIYYFQKAINRCEYFENCKTSIRFETYNGLGIIYRKLHIPDSASFYNDLSYLVDPNLDNQVTALHNQTLTKIENNEFEDAIKYLNLAKSVIDSTENQIGASDNFYLNALLAERKKDYETAYSYFRKYDSLERRIFHESIRSQAKSLEIQFEESENLATIKRQGRDIEERNTLIYFAAILILLFLIFGIILFRSNVLRKKANLQLSQAKQTIEDKNQQLESLNDELESRVKERTFELNNTNEALQKSNHNLDNFIYKTSHDIRGPLATLQGICNVALMDVGDKKAIDYLQKLGKTASRLNEILSKLLVINQINNATLSEDLIDFELIVEHVVQDNRKSNAAEIAIVKEINPNLRYKSDHDLVKIIISNLVNNAFKYHNSSDRIESFIKINIDADIKNIKISIVDNGVGIDDLQGEKIFEIFSKASDTSDSAGLGLYLVKLAVEKLQGQVKLLKTREKFTEFRVKLPNTPIAHV